MQVTVTHTVLCILWVPRFFKSVSTRGQIRAESALPITEKPSLKTFHNVNITKHDTQVTKMVRLQQKKWQQNHNRLVVLQHFLLIVVICSKSSTFTKTDHIQYVLICFLLILVIYPLVKIDMWCDLQYACCCPQVLSTWQFLWFSTFSITCQRKVQIFAIVCSWVRHNHTLPA